MESVAGLQFAAARLGLKLDPASEDRLMSQYRHLSAFPENREVLAELQRRRIPAGILSNGDPEMLAVAVRSAGFTELLQHVISVHPVQRYKTDPAAYALGTAAFGLPAREILFVSSNGWDAIGATWFGYTTLWVNRTGAPLDPLGTSPSHTGRSLRDEVNVILVDAEMPEMDGYVLTKSIKSDKRFDGIPVVMHSSLSSEANRSMGRSVGVDAYVAKFDSEALADTLRPLLLKSQR